MNLGSHRRSIVLIAIFLFPASLLACMWDSDTLQQERARFPTTLELITGKFLRHSKEFYEWRIQDRTAKIKIDAKNPALYDDLAVAYHKSGQSAKAIKTILEKETLFPGLYETYSNLGTFYILDGDFEKGLPLIDKALAINPNAHFGREKYQKWLVEYALSQRVDGKLQFPLRKKNPNSYEPSKFEPGPGFEVFLKSKLARRPEQDDLVAAAQAILGMMRFADHDNPLLLEALGDVLCPKDFDYHSTLDAKQLAARAYLRAAAKWPVDSREYRDFRTIADSAIVLQVGPAGGLAQLPLGDVEWQLDAEMKDAEKWYADLRGREINWIAEGKDVEAEFAKLYREEPTTNGPDAPLRLWDNIFVRFGTIAFAILLATIIVIYYLVRTIRRAIRKHHSRVSNQS